MAYAKPPIDLRGRLLERLQQKGVNFQCELCRVNNWAVIEQPVAVPITDLFSNMSSSILAASIVCNNCGNVRTFALGPLGLLPGSTP